MIRKFQLIVAVACCTSVLGFSIANADEPKDFSGSPVMNDIQLKDFDGFEKTWKLVTIRFRKDTQELRWTFANEQAWKSLESGRTQYPDGAVFIKIGIATNEDPQFVSSAVPSGARRYQVMVRDQKKFASTDGWGYALFDVDGKTFSEDPKTATMACFACHQIVTNRGQVFSQPFVLAPFVKMSFFSEGAGFKKLEFESVEVAKLPEAIRKILPKSLKQVRQISDKKFRTSIFQGTLDEVKPTLEQEVRDSKTPAALVSIDGKRFSIVMPIDLAGCKPGRGYKTVMSLIGGKSDSISREYCNP